jgi:hypothetical protein
VTAALSAQAEAVSPSAGPPTRLRYLVGAAVGSLSRLRPGNGHGRIAEVDGAPSVSSSPLSLNTFDRVAAVDTSETVAMDSSSQMLEMVETSETVEMVDTSETVEMDTSETVQMPYTADTVEMPIPVQEPQPAAPAPFEPDLSIVAQLCARLARIDETREMAALLQDLTAAIDATGLMVWVWDSQAAALTATLQHGYSDEILAQLPKLSREARNATAAAFRTAQTCIVSGGDAVSDALVVPLMTREGCVGVLAMELPEGGARNESIRALATILAAQMARVVKADRPVSASNRRLA